MANLIYPDDLAWEESPDGSKTAQICVNGQRVRIEYYDENTTLSHSFYCVSVIEDNGCPSLRDVTFGDSINELNETIIRLTNA